MFIAALFVRAKTISNSTALQRVDGETNWRNSVLLSNREEEITDTRNSDESQKHYAK